MDVQLMQDEEICAEALPCPFCGSVAGIQKWHGGKPSKRMIRCANEECPVGPGTTGQTKRDALESWNRRVTP